MDMIRSLTLAAAFAAGLTFMGGAAFAQPMTWQPSWNPDIAPTTPTTGISADTTGSMQTSLNNPDRSMPAFDAQSGPRAVHAADAGYYTERVAYRRHHHHRRYGY
jgi:hypothetical protein